jgi:hypothetical protein
MSRRKEPVIPAELLDRLLAGTDAASALGQGGLLDSLKKALAERALGAEMDYHLGSDDQAGNSRNGYGRKTVITDTGKIDIDVPRDRTGSFDPRMALDGSGLAGNGSPTAPNLRKLIRPRTKCCQSNSRKAMRLLAPRRRGGPAAKVEQSGPINLGGRSCCNYSAAWA